MLFHSAIFLFVFLPVTWLVFRALAAFRLERLALGWIVVMSLAFYAYWNPAYLILIVGSIAVNYSLGIRITPAGPMSPAARRWLLYAGLAFNLGLLGYFKYANFFVDSFRGLTGWSFNLTEVLLPLGISFFTFQKIAYLVDAYNGRTGRYSLVEYCFFVTFFPQLIAGPIVQHHQIIPQLEREGAFRFRGTDVAVGLTIFAIGLFKKMVLADGCAIYVAPVFDGAAAPGAGVSAADAWGGALAYTFQLYFDFSGYSDMAIGLARMFGFLLPINFDAPYRATSIIEFWRRWHITLSRFLRNFLYIPLGGNRHGLVLRYRNLLVTMLLGGLWHGAGWTFVIWGGLHGLYLVVNHAFDAGVVARLPEKWRAVRPLRFFGWAVTFLAVVVSWVFFRAGDLGSAVEILRAMAGLGEGGRDLLKDAPWLWLAAVAAVALLFPTTLDYLAKYTPGLDLPPPRGRFQRLAWRPTWAHGLAVGVLVFLTFRRYFVLQPTEFLYFNF